MHEPSREAHRQMARVRGALWSAHQQRVAKAAVRGPLEGDEVEDAPRHRPVRLAVEERHLLRATLDRGHRAVDRRLAAPHDDDALAGRLLAPGEAVRVQHLAGKGRPPWVLGHVRARAAVHARRHHHKVEGLGGGGCGSVVRCEGHRPAGRERLRREDGGVELDEPGEIKVRGEGLDVLCTRSVEGRG